MALAKLSVNPLVKEAAVKLFQFEPE